MAEIANPGSDVPPNQTIYINNINEKIKLDGNFALISSITLVLFSFLIFAYNRAEEVAKCGVFSIREDIRGIGIQDIET